MDARRGVRTRVGAPPWKMKNVFLHVGGGAFFLLVGGFFSKWGPFSSWGGGAFLACPPNYENSCERPCWNVKHIDIPSVHSRTIFPLFIPHLCLHGRGHPPDGDV